MTWRVLLDANVLYPAPLRDLLIRLGIAGGMQTRWTETILDECFRNILKNRPDLTPERLERTRVLMNQALPEVVIEGYEDLIETLTLPDPDDRHVLAAAIHGEVDTIVTFNLKDFPQDVLEEHGLEALHPDAFLLVVLTVHPDALVTAFRAQRNGLRAPRPGIEELLTTLENQGLRSSIPALRLQLEEEDE